MDSLDGKLAAAEAQRSRTTWQVWHLEALDRNLLLRSMEKLTQIGTL